jgi:hypothetical protein
MSWNIINHGVMKIAPQNYYINGSRLNFTVVAESKSKGDNLNSVR